MKRRDRRKSRQIVDRQIGRASATSMREHWKSGYYDTNRTLARRDYMQMPSGGRHVVIHDVHREREMAD
jgi:hypothetical protein